MVCKESWDTRDYGGLMASLSTNFPELQFMFKQRAASLQPDKHPSPLSKKASGIESWEKREKEKAVSPFVLIDIDFPSHSPQTSFNGDRDLTLPGAAGSRAGCRPGYKSFSRFTLLKKKKKKKIKCSCCSMTCDMWLVCCFRCVWLLIESTPPW